MIKRLYIQLFIALLSCGWLTTHAQVMIQEGNIALANVSLTEVNDEMVLALDLVLDQLHLRSNESLVFTPVISSLNGNESATFLPIMINGRKQQIFFQRGMRRSSYPDAMAFRRFNGEAQVVRYLASVPYSSWMDAYQLNLIEDVCGCCGWVSAQSSQEIVYSRPLPTTAYFAFITPPEASSKTGAIEGKAFLDFPVNQSRIYPDYRRNPEELAVILETINVIQNDPNIAVTQIDLHGYASPEGSYSNNARLAQERAEALKEYVRKLYSFNNSLFRVTSTPEDWNGLIAWLENSTLPQKEELLAVATSNLSPDAKDAKIRNSFGAVYRDVLLPDCYPSLRRSDYTVHYEIRPFTAEEAAQLLKTDPSQLNLYEICLAANIYEPFSPHFNEAMLIAVSFNPNSETSNLNAANVSLAQGNLSVAEQYLARAGSSGEAQLSKGILAMWQGDMSTARRLFQEAAAKGVKEASENLKLIENY